MADEDTGGTPDEDAPLPSVAVWIAALVGVVVGGFFGRLAAAQVGMVVGAVLGGLLAAALTALARGVFLLVRSVVRHVRDRSGGTVPPVGGGPRRAS